MTETNTVILLTYHGVGPNGEELPSYEFGVPEEFDVRMALLKVEGDFVFAQYENSDAGRITFNWPKGSKVTRITMQRVQTYGKFGTKEEAELGALRAEGGQPS
jgi:hypothetical protein